jgi:hypothetical protein
MDNTQLKTLLTTHGMLKTVNIETAEGKLFQVVFKQPTDDIMELAYSKDNLFARGKSMYANCKVASDDDELLAKDAGLRHKAYVAALLLDEAGKGVGELKALSVVSEA